MVTTSATFCSWLKSSTNMKLISDASVRRVTHEGITSYDTLVELYKAATKNLPRVCNKSIDAIAADIANNVQAEAAVLGANVPVERFALRQSLRLPSGIPPSFGLYVLCWVFCPPSGSTPSVGCSAVRRDFYFGNQSSVERLALLLAI